MIRNNSISIGILSHIVNAQGTAIKTWDYSGVWNDATAWDDQGVWSDDALSFVCDVQPAVLNAYVYQTWGISDLDANSKLMFADWTLSQFWPAIALGNRVRVDGDGTYDIMAVNPWSKHCAALLKPVQGEAA